MRGLVQAAAEGAQGLSGPLIAGGYADGGLELAQGIPPFALFEVDPAQVHVRELPGLVALGVLGLLQPRNGVVESVLLHEIDADVVVGVAEVGIELDRPVTLPGGFLEPALERVAPAEEGMRLGGRADADRFLVEGDGAIQLPGHLVAIGIAPEDDGPAQGLGGRGGHRDDLTALAARRTAAASDPPARCRPCPAPTAACRRSSCTTRTSE